MEDSLTSRAFLSTLVRPSLLPERSILGPCSDVHLFFDILMNLVSLEMIRRFFSFTVPRIVLRVQRDQRARELRELRARRIINPNTGAPIEGPIGRPITGVFDPITGVEIVPSPTASMDESVAIQVDYILPIWVLNQFANTVVCPSLPAGTREDHADFVAAANSTTVSFFPSLPFLSSIAEKTNE